MSPVDTQGPDEELHHDTQASLSCLAQNYTPPDQLRLVMETVKQVCFCPIIIFFINMPTYWLGRFL